MRGVNDTSPVVVELADAMQSLSGERPRSLPRSAGAGLEVTRRCSRQCVVGVEGADVEELGGGHLLAGQHCEERIVEAVEQQVR